MYISVPITIPTKYGPLAIVHPLDYHHHLKVEITLLSKVVIRFHLRFLLEWALPFRFDAPIETKLLEEIKTLIRTSVERTAGDEGNPLTTIKYPDDEEVLAQFRLWSNESDQINQ